MRRSVHTCPLTHVVVYRSLSAGPCPQAVLCKSPCSHVLLFRFSYAGCTGPCIHKSSYGGYKVSYTNPVCTILCTQVLCTQVCSRRSPRTVLLYTSIYVDGRKVSQVDEIRPNHVDRHRFSTFVKLYSPARCYPRTKANESAVPNCDKWKRLP